VSLQLADSLKHLSSIYAIWSVFAFKTHSSVVVLCVSNLKVVDFVRNKYLRTISQFYRSVGWTPECIKWKFSSHSALLYCHYWFITIGTEKCMDLICTIAPCNCAVMKFIHINVASIIFEKQLITSQRYE
jgi:hypothetical protein